MTKEDLLAVTTPDELDDWALAFAGGGFVASANGGVVVFLAKDPGFVVGTVNREARKLGSVPHPFESRKAEKWGRFANYGTPGAAGLPPTAAAILEQMRRAWHDMKFGAPTGRHNAILRIQRLMGAGSSDPGAGATGGPSATAAVGPDDPPCICHEHQDGDDYVGCDECGGWFHHGCVGFRPEDYGDADPYRCPTCESSQDASEDEDRSKKGPRTTIELEAMTDRHLMSLLAGYAGYRSVKSRTAAEAKITKACPGEYSTADLARLADYEVMMLVARTTGFRDKTARAAAEARVADLAPGLNDKFATAAMNANVLQTTIGGLTKAYNRHKGDAAAVIGRPLGKSRPSDLAGLRRTHVLLRPALGLEGYLVADWHQKILPAFRKDLGERAVGAGGTASTHPRTSAEIDQLVKNFRNRDDVISMAVGGRGKEHVATRAALRRRRAPDGLIAFLDDVQSRTVSAPQTLATLAYFHQWHAPAGTKLKDKRKLFEDGAVAAGCNRSYAQYVRFLQTYRYNNGTTFAAAAAAAAASLAGPRPPKKKATSASEEAKPTKKRKTQGRK